MMITRIPFEQQIIAALLLDLMIGDPHRFPHPVKIIGRFAAMLENPTRRLFKNPRFAGIMTALAVISATGLASYLIIKGAFLLHPLMADAVSILIMYTCFAARDLAGHGFSVYKCLSEGNLDAARNQVSFLVGRDTESLDEAGVARACVESIAENTVDGVTAPLFFAVLGGPIAAILYKAASTLDSTFGYKNERYLNFGWASAKIDDLTNYLPARLTMLTIPIAAFFLCLKPFQSLWIAIRDGDKHASPNSGLSEAAFAGALDVQLGGPVLRAGKPSLMPTMGDSHRSLDSKDIPRAVFLMLATLFVCAVSLIALRMLLLRQ